MGGPWGAVERNWQEVSLLSMALYAMSASKVGKKEMGRIVKGWWRDGLLKRDCAQRQAFDDETHPCMTIDDSMVP